MSDTVNSPAHKPTRRLPSYVKGGLFLLCGLIIGSGLTLMFVSTAIRKMVEAPELLPPRILERMDAYLDLNDEQRVEVEGIVEERIAAFVAIRARFQPEIQTELDSLRNEVSAVLDGEQRAVWETRFDELRARWQPGPLNGK